MTMLVATPEMEAKAHDIAQRYGGGAIPYHAALTAILETTEQLEVGSKSKHSQSKDDVDGAP